MAELKRPFSHPVVEAQASAGAGRGVRVFLRRVSPRGAMVQGADLPDRPPGGVLVLGAAGARRPPLPRWRFAPANG